jgi:hypothetical protein
MTNLALKARIGFSLTAAGVTWLLSAIAFGVYARDARALVAFLIWSIPFFALGWAIVGVPLIALSNQLLSRPGFSLILGISGALAGAMIMLAPGAVARWLSPQTHFVPFSMTELTGWPSLGAAIGASGTLFYSWLLSRYVLLTKQDS